MFIGLLYVVFDGWILLRAIRIYIGLTISHKGLFTCTRMYLLYWTGKIFLYLVLRRRISAMKSIFWEIFFGFHAMHLVKGLTAL